MQLKKSVRLLAGPRAWVATVALAGLAVAACSSNTTSSASGQSGAAPGSPAGTTVAIRAISGMGDVVVDSKGRSLYSSDQETSTKLACTTSDCTAIWTPLTVAAGQSPTGPSQLSAMLSTVKRPDGKTQVALDGKPLYTFTFDHAPGDVGGDNQKDSFGGTNFTWHIATASGSAPAPTSTPSSGGGFTY
jgi:predicted lipoprotein with Yx(FWY)xxD motif